MAGRQSGTIIGNRTNADNDILQEDIVSVKKDLVDLLPIS
jgi:hypothetical protein